MGATRRVLLIMLGGQILVACAQSSPEPSVPPTPSASAQPSEVPPSLAFTWPGRSTPTVTREQAGIEERYINPGAVIEHNGTLHMFANVFTAWPGRVVVPHLVSTDGVAWTLDPAQPVFDSDSVPFADSGADVSTGFVADDGTWVLIFETVSIVDPWVLGRATAPAPQGPWTVDPEPILVAGAEGEMDAGGLAWPWVIPTVDGYAMYYAAFAREQGPGVIARATSVDGVTWTKDPEPVLVAEREWEGGSLDRPRVAVVDDGRLLMIYAGADLTDRGLAWSTDGVSWERDGDRPLISQADFPVEGRAWDAAIVVREGAVVYYLEIGTASANGSTEVYRAVAEL